MKTMISGSIISWQIDGETMETVRNFIWGGSKITRDGDCSHKIQRCLLLGRKAMTEIDSALRSRDITLPTKVLLVKALVFPIVMFGCESWIVEKPVHQGTYFFFLTVMLEETLESPLHWKEIKLVSPKGNQSWIFFGRTDAEAEAPIFCHLMQRIDSLGKKKPDAGKDWRQEEMETTEDEMVGWHHQFNGHEFEQAPGVGDRQKSLVCYNPWGHKASYMIERLNWTDLSFSSWLTSFWILGSRFIYLIRTDSNMFLFIAESCSIACMYHNFLIHSSAEGYLGYFHVLAIVNSASMNVEVQESLSVLVFL